MNARTKARDVEILPRSLITANIEKCARFARDPVIIVVSFFLVHNYHYKVLFNN